MNNQEKGTIKQNVFNLYLGQKVISIDGTLVHKYDALDKEILALSKNTYLQLKSLSTIKFSDAVEIIRMERATYDVSRINNLLWNDVPNILSVIYSKTIKGGGLYYNYSYGKLNLPVESATLFFKDSKYFIFDFLRSKGYAVPYLQYTVEDMVEMGIMKLSEPVGFGEMDVNITNDIPIPREKTMLEKINAMASYISEHSSNRFQDSDHIDIKNIQPLQKMTLLEKLPSMCVNGWNTQMYCSGNNQCELCRTNFTLKI